MKRGLNIVCMIISSIGLIYGQRAADSVLTISRFLDEVEVVHERSAQFVEQDATSLIVNMDQIQKMPKFLSTSDPVRYIQSLSGIATNSESRAGIHLQGCDDYQSIVAINGAPVHYPNHMLGLYSTFIPQHFSRIELEHSVHRSNFPNRLGGMVNMQTKSYQPSRFAAEGSLGLIASDLTLTIPCGKKSALWMSGRASYISPIYGKYLSSYGMNMNYDFQDGNLTYAYHPTEQDEVVVSAFVSHDAAKVKSGDSQAKVEWYNAVGSAYWDHDEDWIHFRSTLSGSGYFNTVNMSMFYGSGNERAGLATIEWKNQLDMIVRDDITLCTGLDYIHHIVKPMRLIAQSDNRHLTIAPPLVHGDEVSLYADICHHVTDWFNYKMGVRASGNVSQRYFMGGIDPRMTFEFLPAENHHLYLHVGSYTQYTHKVSLLDGGLPADFVVLANEAFKPERAHSISLSYQTDFLEKKYSATSSIYFKQLFHVVESTSNLFSLVNKEFDYESNLQDGRGRNYGWDVMLQRNKGYVTGYVSYSLSWAKRQLPGLQGFQDYRYSASHERRHDLKIVLNSQVHRQVNIGAQFVLASGLPYTAPQEVYMIGGKLICHYADYNTSHLPLYHRLDLSVNYDIIKRKGHLFGINMSLYNVYNHNNAQFVVYRTNLRPFYGETISRIIPSFCIYGKW